MVSHISGLQAEFKLRPFEKITMETLRSTPVCWVGYVDNIYIAWNHEKEELHYFLDKINSLDNRIKFILEIQQNQKLAF